MPERSAPKITISGADRVGFFGRTGSGKTTLARHMLGVTYARTHKPFVVLDPKRTYRQEGVPVHRDFRAKEDRQILRDDGYGDLDYWDAQLHAIRRAGNRIVYVDETLLITPPRAILPELGHTIRTGRERGVAVWCGSQRPKELPSPIFTEAEHFFIFRLQWEADREKVASFTTDEMHEHMAAIKTAKRKHDAVYYDVLNDRIISLYMTRAEAPDGKRRRRSRSRA